MTTPISSISGATPSLAAWPTQGTPSARQGSSFKDFLLGSVSEVNTSQQQAAVLVEQLYTGGNVNPSEVMVSVQKADMAFRLLLQVRNKLLQAYEEVKNIRI